jgi:DnaK suppressor protein
VTGSPDPRAALLAERERTASRLAGLERDFTSSVEAADMANADDEHDPEGATLAFERQHVASLKDRARDQLSQIDAALGRLDAGSYGLCGSCGRPIAPERLAARPAAPECINCADRPSTGSARPSRP